MNKQTAIQQDRKAQLVITWALWRRVMEGNMPFRVTTFASGVEQLLRERVSKREVNKVWTRVLGIAKADTEDITEPTLARLVDVFEVHEWELADLYHILNASSGFAASRDGSGEVLRVEGEGCRLGNVLFSDLDDLAIAVGSNLRTTKNGELQPKNYVSIPELLELDSLTGGRDQ